MEVVKLPILLYSFTHCDVARLPGRAVRLSVELSSAEAGLQLFSRFWFA
jgi:hypothetical protein